MINSKGELIDEGDVVCDACLASEVLEVGDILLEPVISGSVGAANGFLDELGKVQAGSGSGVEGLFLSESESILMSLGSELGTRYSP